tara:strand:- start:214 stop:501 length:288 start_codon:yes stop_codon:yes gene_type:complete
MKVIVIATRNQEASAEEFSPYLGPEADHVIGMIKEDIVREVYSRSDGQGAVVVLECKDIDHAKKIIGEFPLAKAGLLTAEFYGANPYRGVVQHAK